MKCKNCKTKVEINQKYCPECGNEIIIKKKVSKQAQAIIACVCCLVLIISGTIGGLYFYKNNNLVDDSDSNYIAFKAGFTDVKVTDEESALEAISSVADVIGIENVEEELKISSTNTIDGDTYYRFQQYYNDIPVYGNSISLVSDNNKDVVALTSNFLSNVKVDLNKKTKSDIQIQNAIKKFLRKKISNDINIYMISEINESNRIIYNIDKPFLAFSVSVITDYGAYNLIIDAVSGKVVFYTDETNYVQKESKINGQNGEQSFTAETDGKINTMKYISPSGTEITVSTPKSKNKFDWYYPDNSDIVTWKKDNKVNKSAVDMMTNITNIYYYYLNSFQRDSLDDKKIPLRLFVNTEGYKSYDGEDIPKINNAFFWLSPNGPVLVSTKNFENGKEIAELSSNLDVLAHEYTHGVIHYTCALRDTQYNSFPGAINEGISDIFGVLAEQSIAKWSEPDWFMAEDIRNIKDPHWNSVKHPYPKNIEELHNSKTYSDKDGITYYIDDEENERSDFCHFACSIISHSAYLMWNGLNGNPEKKIDSNSLGKLWYSALFLMQSDATFSQCRNAVELSARILLKNGELTQKQYQCVLESFDEVGIENAPYTYYYLVKNDFNLRVLNSKETDDVNFNLKVSKPSETELMGAPELVLEENSLYGNKEIHLEDGVYYLEITDLDENAQNSVPIKTKILVDGEDENAVDEVVIHTDFSDITTVVLNKYEKDENLQLIPGEYVFSAGVGAWSTELNINDDFTFSGIYHDSELGLTGERNPNGTVIICEFTGKFATPVKIDDYTYKLTVESMSLKNKDGYVYYDNGIEYECVGEPYGFDACRDFYLYIKGRPTSDLSDEFLGWIYEYDEKSGILPCNCIRNPQTDVCFAKYESTETNNTEDTQGESTTIKESNENKVGRFYGNETAEQLRKSIIGSWGALGSIVPEYNFMDSENCSGVGPWQSSGTYSISNDKALTIKWGGKSEREEYVWSSESWDEFYSHHEYGADFWYMTDDGILKLNGKEKYRDGVDNFTYNSDGNLMSIISGTWISDKGYKEYQINSDGTWVESTVVISGGKIINRTKLDNGKVEIIDDTTAKLWQEVEHLNQIPGASELIYDSKNDKISVGGTNNTFTRAKYK